MFTRMKRHWRVLLLLLLWVALVPAVLAFAGEVQVTVDTLNVRSSPSLDAAIMTTVNKNAILPVLSQQENWVKVKLPSGQEGWIAGWMVKSVASGTAQDTIKSTVDNLNIRSGPGLTFPVIANINTDRSYPVLQKSGQWIQIQLADGKKGWAANWLVKLTSGSVNTGSNPATPVTSPTSPATQPAQTGSGSTHTSTSAPATGSGQATVNAGVLNLRSQPKTDSDLVTILSQGTSLTLLEKQGDWYRVEDPNGYTGWVAGWLLDVKESAVPSTQSYLSILNPDTNVRSGPGTTYDIVGRVQAGERYAILKKEADWFQIKLANGTIGFVAGWLVNAEGMPTVNRGNGGGGGLAGKKIVIDAGHGGNDNGATGASFSTLEKTINLQVALLLKNKLEAGGASVIMTRTDDRKLTLQDRVDVAVNNQADIFVSIHHNTHPNPMTNGTIVFYYTEGPSSQLAALVQSELVRATNYKDLGSRFGDYFVLRENSRVSILAEIGFLSNYQEEILLRSAKQQELAADGIYKGILRYFSE